ncbi:MAG: MBL fold metallo-hydrolase [Candidatus Aminicenantes bacterium]|nr:MAG: MBL fold metallo-hydrolase [Candidatus Aminicenantes bacterium]
MLEFCGKRCSNTKHLSFLSLLCVLLIAANPVQIRAAQEVEVTYTGNEGFMIVVEGKKILIDAFHRLGDLKHQELLQNGKPPFDDVDLILTTHTDHDHFDLHMVGHYLTNHPKSLFLSTKQATDAFTKYYKNFEKIKARLKGFAPEEGERIHFSHEDIDVTMILLHHGWNRKVKVTNLGFLFFIGGKKFFHMGDSEIVLSELNIYNLPEEKIDVAFVPYWYFTSEKYKPALQKGIGAKQVIPMHLILVDGGPQERLRIMNRIFSEFPDAILFSEEMEKSVIQ